MSGFPFCVDDVVLTNCLSVLPTLGDSASKQCRALGYRAIRLALVAPESVKTICEKVQWFVVKYVLLLLAFLRIVPYRLLHPQDTDSR